MSSKGRKATSFKKGNIPWNKSNRELSTDHLPSSVLPTAAESQEYATVRLGEEEFSLVCTTEGNADCLSTPDCEGKSGNVRLLRPKNTQTSSLQQSEEIEEYSGMRLINFEKMSEAFNDAFRQHQDTSCECEQPHFTVVQERKFGLGWKICLGCSNCNFIGTEKKLYKEAETPRRGPNAAAVNIGLAVGLQDTPLGNTRCRSLLASMDVPPPARSAMQKTSNRVGEAVVKLNKTDMAEKVDILKAVNKARGHPESAINISMDGRYNSTCISSRRKPGQNASQAIAVACETITDKQYIVATATQNKLCWTGAWLRGRGFDVTCPGGHEDCTANTHGHAPLSEFELGKSIGHELGVQGAFVRYVTTDGDSKSSAGVAEAIRLLDPMWKVDRLADPIHLGQSQFRRCYSAKFSDGMFPGRTRENRQQQQKALSRDVKARSSLVIKELMELHEGDIGKIKKELPHVLLATVRCYSGDCSLCRRHSYVCSGGTNNSWWERSMFLSTHQLHQLCMTENDKELLMEILKIKLSVGAMELMKLGTTTQKCEAVNRAISVSLPKNVNYGRNMEGRLASTILRMNNGLAESTEKKLGEFGVELSGASKKALDQIQKEAEYHKNYAKRPQTLKRTLLNKGRNLSDYLQYKNTHSTSSGYCKGMLDKDIHKRSKGDNSSDHDYTK